MRIYRNGNHTKWGASNKWLGWWLHWKILVFTLLYKTTRKNGKEKYHSPLLKIMNLTGTKSIFYIGTKSSYTYLKKQNKTLWLCSTEEVGWAVAFKARLGLVPLNPLTAPPVTLLVFHFVLASLLISSNLPCQPKCLCTCNFLCLYSLPLR